MLPPVSVSIIVPVYNVAPYVGRCVDSVISQTYPHLECIFVDDCGNDNSMEIVRERIANYHGNIRFKILKHERNRGLSAARNTGTVATSGEYIYYLDSDDLITSDCIALLAEPLRERRVDFVLGNYASGGIKSCFLPVKLEAGFLCGNEEIRRRAMRCDWPMMAWNTLFNKEFLSREKLQFLEGLLHEDNLWSFQVGCVAKSMCFVPALTYLYSVRENSITTAKSRKNFDALVRIAEECVAFARERGIENVPEVLKFTTIQRENLFSAARDYGLKTTWNIYCSQSRSRAFSWETFRVLGATSKLRYLHHLLPKSLGFVYCLFFFSRIAKFAVRHLLCLPNGARSFEQQA